MFTATHLHAFHYDALIEWSIWHSNSVSWWSHFLWVY